MANGHSCLIWGYGYEAKVANPCRQGSDSLFLVRDSARAGGGYVLTDEARYKLSEGWFDASEKARLTTWLIDQRIMGVRYPLVTEGILDEIRRRPPLPVHERANRLLRFIFSKANKVASTVDIRWDTWQAYAWSESTDWDEVFYLLDYLEEMRWIQDGKRSGEGWFLGGLTVQGHNHIAERQRNIESSQVFVAMWFHDNTNDAFEKGIEPAVKDAGYRPMRIDKKEHVNKIDDEIIAEIRRSRFLVADFTHGDDGARGGVYYEAGFAHGLGLPVIFTCRKDSIGTLHFDTSHYNHIVWETPAQLREMLKNRILAVIGEGPETQA